jgi:uncharacterized FlaG/YvyC family protein
MNISSTTPVVTPSDLYSGLTPAETTERQKVVSAMRTVNADNMFGASRELTFSVDRTTRRMIIHVIDRDTHETVMQLPPEYILRLAADLQHGP